MEKRVLCSKIIVSSGYVSAWSCSSFVLGMYQFGFFINHFSSLIYLCTEWLWMTAIVYYSLEEVRLEFLCSIDNRELDSATSYFTRKNKSNIANTIDCISVSHFLGTIWVSYAFLQYKITLQIIKPWLNMNFWLLLRQLMIQTKF